MNGNKLNYREKEIEGRWDTKHKNVLSSLIYMFEFIFKVTIVLYRFKLQCCVFSHKMKLFLLTLFIKFSAYHRSSVETTDITD